MNTRNRISAHYRAYEQLELRDIFKFLHQSTFGCEHMVSSLEAATAYIKKEAENISDQKPLVEELDGEFSRVHLSVLSEGLTAETLSKLFYLSARKPKASLLALEEKLKTVKDMITDGSLPFDEKEFDKAVTEWKQNGYEALHHSDTFRSAYKPAYRVVSNCFVPFLPLFTAIDKALENGRAVLAIEGRSASGKTTLAEMLEEIYGCTVFHTDDFFLQAHQRTPERFAEVGGNLDRERFYDEVIVPLKENKPVSYRRFDCSTFTLLPPVEIQPQKLTVIEGAYSLHPYFGDYCNISVFLDISKDLQKERILNRNPEMADRFFDEWIPLEEKYFADTTRLPGHSIDVQTPVSTHAPSDTAAHGESAAVR